MKKIITIIILILVILPISACNSNKKNIENSNKKTQVKVDKLLTFKNKHDVVLNKLKNEVYEMENNKKIYGYKDINFNNLTDQEYYSKVNGLLRLAIQESMDNEPDSKAYVKIYDELSKYSSIAK